MSERGSRIRPTRTMLRSAWHFHSAHPVQLFTTVTGIALGVAAVVAMDLAASSARDAFSSAASLLAGQATHTLESRMGDLPEDALYHLRVDLGIRTATPVVEGTVRLAPAMGRGLRLVGTDLLIGSQFRWGWLNNPAVGGDLLASPGTVMAAADLLDSLGLPDPAETELAAPVAGQSIRIVSAGPDNDAALPGNTLVTDIGTAQTLLGSVGFLSRLELILEPGQADQLSSMLPPMWKLRSMAAASGDTESLTRSFRVSLQALSLLALLVGAFLVYSTVSFAVVRRRRSLGLMAAMGAHRRQILVAVMAETLLLAVPAVLMGLLAGMGLGAGLVRLVLRTVGDLYGAGAGDYFVVPALLLVKGACLGLGVSLLAGLLPALEASSAGPMAALSRADLERRSRRRSLFAALGGSLLTAAGALVLSSGPALIPAYGAIFLVLSGCAFMTPLWLMALALGLGRLFSAVGRTMGAHGARRVAHSVSRSGPAGAALMLAVATVIGVSVMVASFRDSVTGWLDYSLDSDRVIYLPENQSPESRSTLLQALAESDHVSGFSLVRRVPVPDQRGLGRLMAVKPGPGRWPLVRDGTRDSALAKLSEGGVLVSDTWTRWHRTEKGEGVTLFTPDGPRSFPLAGRFVDYSSEQGMVAVHLDLYREIWGDMKISSIGVYSVPGRLDPLDDLLAGIVGETGGRFLDTSQLRDISLQVFNRTFTITGVLRWLAAIVACVGLINAMQAMALDAVRETSILRSLGLSPGGVAGLQASQALVMGLGAGLAAVPTGLCLAWLLVRVINRLAFGWEIFFRVDPILVLQGLALSVSAALLASLWPAWRLSRMPPVAALQQE